MLSNDFITFTLEKKKSIALIAHDNEKHALIEWCKEHKSALEKHTLCGTGTTARMITDQTGLPVKATTAAPWVVTSRSAQRLWKEESTWSSSFPTLSPHSLTTRM